MNIKSIFGLVVAGFLLSASQISAAQYLDSDVPGNIAAGATYNGSFSIINTSDVTGVFGYDKSSEEIVSTVVDFSFRVAGLASKVLITIGGFTFSGTEIPGTFTHLIGDVGAALGALSTDGVLNYSIQNLTTSRITVSGAALTAKVVAQPVPDAGLSAILIGLGCLGMGVFSRRVRGVV